MQADQATELTIRPMAPDDAPAVRALVAHHARRGVLLDALPRPAAGQPAPLVAVESGRPIGCGALVLLTAETAEVRSLAVDPARQSAGVGGALLSQLVATAASHSVRTLFARTFCTGFFARFGFEPVAGADAGDRLLGRPNTLGNVLLALRLETGD